MRISHENKYAIYLMTGALMHIIYKKDLCIDLKAAQHVVRDRMMLQNGKEMPVLCDIREVRRVNKPARDYLALEGSPMDNRFGLFDRSPGNGCDQQCLLGHPCTNNPHPVLYQKIRGSCLFKSSIANYKITSYRNDPLFKNR